MDKELKYRKKPVEVRAVRFTDENKNQVYGWAREIQQNVYHSTDKEGNPELLIPTLEGEMICSLGDYLIVEPFPTDWRKLYPCKPDIFEKTYEAVHSPSFREQPLREALEKIAYLLQGEPSEENAAEAFQIARTALAGEGDGWIRVEDGLPGEPGIYDVKKVYSKGQEKGQYDGICFTNYDGYRVTHWRPTPPQTK